MVASFRMGGFFMFRNHAFFLIGILVLIIMSILNGQSFANDSAIDIDFTTAIKGVVHVNYMTTPKKNTKIVVQKEDDVAYYPCNQSNAIPLVFGSGTYIVGVYERTDGNEYEEIESKTASVVINNSEDVFTQKIGLVYWSDQQELTKVAEALTQKCTTNEDKARLIYQYLVKQLQYDQDKAKLTLDQYEANPELTFDSQSGICLDFATLYATMLRSVGVPTKVVMGYKSDIDGYHAWNQIYSEKSEAWLTVDLTYDIGYLKFKKKSNFIKVATDYKVASFY